MQTISIIQNQTIHSKYLKRDVYFDIILPPNYKKSNEKLKILYMNDGQDIKNLHLESCLNSLYANSIIEPFILVAIKTQNRLQEYGTASILDYKNRGSLAKVYNHFIINELRKEMIEKYNVSDLAEDNYFCGFSLGGLSAIDIVWANPDKFSKVGVFSGSFWWRMKAYEDNYDDDNDRIMHTLIRNGNFNPNQAFWFECGTKDETEDRNNNGIIDSIDDTLDLIKELELKGYKQGENIIYVEIEDGEHNYKTWSKAMPIFLEWLLAKN